MLDPFFVPSPLAVREAVRPWAERYAMSSLPLHVHEVLGAALFYTFVQYAVSPWLSSVCFPRYYPRDSRSKRANWDSHVVSLVQSVLINGLALWVMFTDRERKAMDWQQRIWGYTGASGMVQALAAGYFVWDLMLTVNYFDVFGPGMLAHAVSALTVFAFGFRPFLNFYGCVFILYELSTPFLNIHWFLDKLHMTGSRLQLYNGIALLFTFFSCRLVWGTAQSVRVYADMWRALHATPDAVGLLAGHEDNGVMAFAANAGPVPLWMVALYTASNLVLNGLNWYWFFKMIAAVRKRFEPAPEEAKAEQVDGAAAPSTTTTAGTPRSAAESTGADAIPLAELRKRRNTLEDMLPDSEELRDGTIQ